jgi:hypothetical protein
MTPSSPRSQLQENIEIQVAEKVRSSKLCNQYSFGSLTLNKTP